MWQQRLKQVMQEIPWLFTVGRTVLYVGATPSRFQMGQELFEAGYEITLLEAYKPFADYYESHPWLKRVICGDVRDIPKIAEDCRWDVTVWWHGPEHVRRGELKGTLAGLESVTARLVVLGVPWGYNLQRQQGENPFSVHRSHLNTDDLVIYGYVTRTLGKQNDYHSGSHILAWKDLRRKVNGNSW